MSNSERTLREIQKDPTRNITRVRIDKLSNAQRDEVLDALLDRLGLQAIQIDQTQGDGSAHTWFLVVSEYIKT